jgi:antitoxin (DNA-binding transcriptional repressor) of toxin-antitoxin stability system
MKTLTVTTARKDLGRWLKRAVQGEDIGVIVDGRIVALRPVQVYPDDYALREYGVSEGELDSTVALVRRDIAKAKAKGKLKPLRGRLTRDAL